MLFYRHTKVFIQSTKYEEFIQKVYSSLFKPKKLLTNFKIITLFVSFNDDWPDIHFLHKFMCFYTDVLSFNIILSWSSLFKFL